MRVTTLFVKADPDGVLRLSVPAEPGGEYSIAVVMVERPTTTATPTKTPEELGWPPGYFENVIGSIDDDTFMTHPQPSLPPPPEPIG